MPLGIGWQEILLVMLVALLIFGPKKLPEMGRSLGRGFREFKDSISGKDADDELDELPPPAPEDETRVASGRRRRQTTP